MPTDIILGSNEIDIKATQINFDGKVTATKALHLNSTLQLGSNTSKPALKITNKGRAELGTSTKGGANGTLIVAGTSGRSTLTPGKITSKAIEAQSNLTAGKSPIHEDSGYRGGSDGAIKVHNAKLKKPAIELSGKTGNIKLSGTLQYTNGKKPLIELFESGTSNPKRPIITHSKAHPTWGLFYEDQGDTMIFQQSGKPVLAAALGTSRVGINTAKPQYALHVVGQIASTQEIKHLSDATFKKDITPIKDAKNRLLKLRGVTYEWRKNEFPDLQLGNESSAGFIAQEVETVIPEAVSRDESGHRFLKPHALLPYLVETVKEQQSRIEELETQAKDNERRLKRLEALLTPATS